ncbi:hypothetical protein ACFOQM_19970 [Paenibacillus sp. GCM10012307]|uniref:Uncharacterized protein n=1 Tax=Paenibacillus roseus TaxID=2798579 RepID=A0A934MSQ8_9BACL|nr:hypothetical protein [Paenibacillus roseus]MBJ6363504.1 hypothetical protein [Paenibacillus roseus]
MNDGYLAGLLLIMIGILLSTGWRSLIIQEISIRIVGCVLLGSLLLSSQMWPVTASLAIQGSVAWLLLWGIIAGAVSVSRSGLMYVAFGAALIAVVWFWSGRLYWLDPVLYVFKPGWDGVFFAGLLAGLLVGTFKDQFAVLACALPAGQLLLGLSIGNGGHDIGGANWWDHFVSALILARLTSVVLQLFIKLGSKLGLHRLKDQGGEPS